MSIYRTNNPTEFDEVDGIIIDESAPPSQVKGVGTGIAILVGQFLRGKAELRQISDIGDFHKVYGKSDYIGNIQLKNKKFSGLKIVRVIAENAVASTVTVTDGEVAPTDLVKFTAKDKGVYGNKLQVIVADGTVDGKKITIKDLNTSMSEFYPDEVFDGVAIAEIKSNIVDIQILANGVLNNGTYNLATGTDGVIVDSDYEKAIELCNGENSGNILFLDQYNQVRNAMLKAHAGLTQDKMVICSEDENDTVSDNETDVALLRDGDGRIIYASNWISTIVNGAEVFTSPASWYASILSQSGPHIDPASAENAQFLAGAIRVKKNLSRPDFIRLNKAGVSSFEFDADIGIKVKSGVVTQIANTSKVMVFRRRMADYLTNSIARAMKPYQNNVNSKQKRLDAKGAIANFNRQVEADGMAPKDSEMTDGAKASIIDIESKNTNASIASGRFYITYKRRLYSSMRYIILQAEIGEGVEVKEGE